ncbi:hypothetical protein H072_7739 [Dactylellina haptotyla CBS 200.50]|uniref:Uncharacterized protein n=1 Tax=Dactylellina haptotyla (strain CBS 200.50) TaxID=1284197 RepID=S8BTF7_DACHA|nr:hypothetical protein H072_7739 [Dactylellina haptotyla CBS 200.50]
MSDQNPTAAPTQPPAEAGSSSSAAAAGHADAMGEAIDPQLSREEQQKVLMQMQLRLDQYQAYADRLSALAAEQTPVDGKVTITLENPAEDEGGDDGDENWEDDEEEGGEDGDEGGEEDGEDASKPPKQAGSDSLGPSDSISAASTDTFGRGKPRRVREEARPESFYPHPLDGEDVWGSCLAYKEQYIRSFSAAIRNKPNWTEKVLDRELFAKWLREAEKQNSKNDKTGSLTWDAADIAFAYKELTEQYKPYVEELRKQGLTIEPDIDAVWRTDQLIDEDLRKQLIDAVATLENVPDDKKDWHPGSKKQVLDLVHPSLWPIIYGRSVSIENGETIKVPKETMQDKEGFSKRFCWLPSEFEISSDGKETKIASYINNLAESEDQKALFYPILEKIFTKFVPLFNHVLGDLRMGKHDLKRVYASGGSKYWDEDIVKLLKADHQVKWDKLLDQFVKGEPLNVDFMEKKKKEKKKKPEGETVEMEVNTDAKPVDDDGDANFEDVDSDVEDPESESDPETTNWEENDSRGYAVRDTMGNFSDWDWTPPKITDEIKLEGKTVKVIVKLANIILTPDKPEYAGGSWHVEAMLNERIISTGIYYFAQENISDSELAFRRTVSDVPHVMDLQQYSDWPIIFNMESWDAFTVQKIGSIQTKEHRAIAFPNVFQHQVQPFKLTDPTKPGYRKILVFFLCDPSPEHELPTTKTVAPQQPEARSLTEDILRNGPMGRMPEEVFSMIVENLPPPVTREEAEAYRRDLMKERSTYNKSTTMVTGVSYSLCEH